MCHTDKQVNCTGILEYEDVSAYLWNAFAGTVNERFTGALSLSLRKYLNKAVDSVNYKEFYQIEFYQLYIVA